MSNKKIKMLFSATVLPSFLHNNKNRSGILFASLNLLKEFSKYEDVEITLFYEYQTYKDIVKLQESGIVPENCKFLNVEDVVPPSIIPFLDYLSDLSLKYAKGKNDNILKKILRFFIYRAFRFFYNFALPHSNFKNVINNYNVFFSPCFKIHPLILSKENIKSYLLIYDLIPIKLAKYYKGFEEQLAGMEKIAKSINYKNTYFAISENTKKDIIEYRKGIDPSHIVVSLLGADDRFYCEKNKDVINRTKQKYGISADKKYIFSLCTLEPRKNLVFAIRNFLEFVKKNNITDFVFVLGGASWQKFPEILETQINKFESAKDLIQTIGYVEDEDVPVLYSGAEFFVYPTLYEGFGLPVLEAMQCGCPVITSDNSSMPEVIGDAGIMINPYSDEQMVQAMEKMYFDSEFRNSCSQKGFERAKIFSWEKTSDIIINKIREDLNNETPV